RPPGGSGDARMRRHGVRTHRDLRRPRGAAQGGAGQGDDGAKRGAEGAPRRHGMTHAAPPQGETTFSMAERGGDAFIRQRGRDFLFSLYGTLRALKLYPPENAVVQKALLDLQGLTDTVYRREHELEVRASREFIFLNSTRLRL